MKTDPVQPIDVNRTDALLWAYRSLGVTDQNRPAETAAGLSLVTKHEYVLASDSVNAALVIAGMNQNDTMPGIRRGTELRLMEEIHQFAEAFFDLELHARMQKWHELSAACESFPSLRRWLEHLRTGIALTKLPEVTTETARELVQGCCKVFSSRPPERFRRQQEFLSICHDLRELWEPEVDQFVTQNSNFVSQIAPWLQQIKWTRIEDQPVVRIQAPRDYQRPSQRSEAANKGTGSPFAYIWVLVVISSIGRMGMNSRPSPSPPTEPKYGMNSTPWQFEKSPRPKVDQANLSFTNELNEFVPREFSFNNFPQATIDELLIEIPGLRKWLNDANKQKRLESLVNSRFPDLTQMIVIHCRARIADRVNYRYDSYSTLAKTAPTLERFRAFLRELDKSSTETSDDQPASALNTANGSDSP